VLRWGAGVGVAGLLALANVHAREQAPLPVPLSELPAEARAVDHAIRSGGPFAYPKDGIVFANRERILPPERRGFYREYTVATQGARDRGARRFVCGGKQPSAPVACYYSNDHYASFHRITP
jgi:ribonuclease T1